jgi:hypothetical protein
MRYGASIGKPYYKQEEKKPVQAPKAMDPVPAKPAFKTTVKTEEKNKD